MQIRSIDEALQAVGGYVGHARLEVPQRGEGWSIEGDRVVLELPAATLERHLQDTSAAAPSYLLALTWWLRAGGAAPWRALVRVVGGAAPSPALRRAARLLALYETLFDWFEVELDPALRWQLPGRPVLNVEAASRDVAPTPLGGTREAELEYRLYDVPGEFGALNRLLPEGERLRALDAGHLLQRQLPLGLFDGKVSAGTEWLPGKRAAVDLWGASEDGRVLHLFELKAENNARLGILPEALDYATLCAEARDGRVAFDASASRGLNAVRRAEDLVMWLVAPGFHPLLRTPAGTLRGRSPLEAVNAALAPRRIELRLLPYRLRPEAPGGLRFAWDGGSAWPRAFA